MFVSLGSSRKWCVYTEVPWHFIYPQVQSSFKYHFSCHQGMKTLLFSGNEWYSTHFSMVFGLDSWQSISISLPNYGGRILMHGLEESHWSLSPFSVSRSTTSSRAPLGQQALRALWLVEDRKLRPFLKWPHLIGPAPPPRLGCGYRGNKTSGKTLRDQNREVGGDENPRDESNTSAKDPLCSCKLLGSFPKACVVLQHNSNTTHTHKICIHDKMVHLENFFLKYFFSFWLDLK